MLNLAQYPIRVAEVIGHMVADEAVIVVPNQGKVKVLNVVGARIWSLADGKHSIGDISSIISQEYQVDQTQSEMDVSEFIQELIKQNIVQLHSESITE